MVESQENIETQFDDTEDTYSESRIIKRNGNKYVIDYESGNVYHLHDDVNDVNDDQSQEPESVDSALVKEQEEDLTEKKDDLTDSDLNEKNPVEDNAIKNNTEGEINLVETTENDKNDLVPYQETKETKPDGAFSMMERNIAECQRKSDYKKSREECAKEVKNKMAGKNMPIIETKDTNEEEVSEEETETEQEAEPEPKKDIVEICPKELDMLKEKAEKYDQLKKDHDDLQKEHDGFKNDFLAFKKKIEDKEKAEIEVKRQDLIDKISYDFDISKEEIKDDSIEDLEKLQKRFNMVFRTDTEEDEEETEEDMDELTADAIHKKYFIAA